MFGFAFYKPRLQNCVENVNIFKSEFEYQT